MVSAAALEIERLKLLLARMRRERFGQSSERGARLIEQLELQLAELEEGFDVVFISVLALRGSRPDVRLR